MEFLDAYAIISQVLIEKNFNVESDINQMLGTMAVESDFGRLTKQVGGQALSIFQIERPTFDFLQKKYGKQYGVSGIKFENIEHDHRLAALFCRLKYLSINKPLPAPDDVPGMAKFWKKYYNTPKGKGKVSDFITKYKKYVKK